MGECEEVARNQDTQVQTLKIDSSVFTAMDD